ncbi:hypothetical protein [Arthrobacter sp. Soil762]|uniref:hypothetical protein n=1 Tax=Arthrobacter sp. Soil762 TaxID=1736401 RepID=UPI0006F3EF87|nr:hypothetical protein [Arthrobacter sp. Soil762]KRE72578.1 hypothetical protein ASG77_07870 [Arthrobacter sp. Soil762]
MAILSTFYDSSAGTPASLVTEVKWAKAHPHIGSSEYGVDGPGDFKVTAHPSTPYAVNVAAGKAWGHGVLDESDDVVTVVCDAPAAGVTRWDLITVRRDWTPLAGGPTSVTKVAGGVEKALPAARENTPGTLDDQPLYLAKWVGGQTQPQELVDLRCWAGNGGMYAKDELVLTYLTRIGSEININAVLWRLVIGPLDTLSWIKTGELGKIPLFGAGGKLNGGVPPNGGDFLIQAGSVVSVTDNSGYARFSWPKPFPNGLLSVTLTNGDDWAPGRIVFMSVAGRENFWGPAGIGDKTEVVYVLEGINSQNVWGKIGNTLHRVNFVAIGW